MTSVGSPLTLNKAVIGTQQGFPNPGADGGSEKGILILHLPSLTPPCPVTHQPFVMPSDSCRFRFLSDSVTDKEA